MDCPEIAPEHPPNDSVHSIETVPLISVTPPSADRQAQSDTLQSEGAQCNNLTPTALDDELAVSSDTSTTPDSTPALPGPGPGPMALELRSGKNMDADPAPCKLHTLPNITKVSHVIQIKDVATPNETAQEPSEGSAPKLYIPAIPYSRTLGAAIANTRAQGAALREHRRKNPIIKSPPPSSTSQSTLDRSLVPQSGITGNRLVDSVIDDLQNSCYCLWVGDAKQIVKSCEWVKNTVTNSYTLMWKSDCPLKPTGGDGTALVGWIGQVSGKLSKLTPDAGWTYPSNMQQNQYNAGLCDKKRTVSLGRPDVATRFPHQIWDTQVKGVTAIQEHGRRLANAKSPVTMISSFYEPENDCFCARTPMFLPPPVLVVDSDDEDLQSHNEGEESYDDEQDNEIPPTHWHPTWQITLPRVEALIEQLSEQGYQPQIINARNRFNKLIHPNNVYATLNGTIAYVYATLEKQLFTSSKYPGGRAWRFSANLVQVQALKAPPAPKPSSLKRKAHSYNMSNIYKEGHGTEGGSSSKRVKF
ncbi:hypothetical protein RhiXN_10999 [Rhizoctonia solani]|uniref:Uncharacterized protein n=1 Tax=Rhizoctonia solani TaxID=456999 RepID=A0A8H8P9F5_9AGAM|nr:uncharacterized protein RhiXN_10999 [Rhizoctonia solani]QRW25922.1 hypothetical protein RhiXN_10999 [Rhizoctonia solani]